MKKTIIHYHDFGMLKTACDLYIADVHYKQATNDKYGVTCRDCKKAMKKLEEWGRQFTNKTNTPWEQSKHYGHYS